MRRTTDSQMYERAAIELSNWCLRHTERISDTTRVSFWFRNIFATDGDRSGRRWPVDDSWHGDFSPGRTLHECANGKLPLEAGIRREL